LLCDKIKINLSEIQKEQKMTEKLDLKQGKNIYLIGLTGNIACGKSAVIGMLNAKGATTIDADTLVHKIQQPGGIAYQPVIAEFGADILTEGAGSPIDRRKLGNIVFADKAALRRLELIVHPLVRLELLATIANAPSEVVVLDAIKLLENRLDTGCDAVWVVTCSPEVQVKRLMARNNFSEEEALLRINAQPPQAEKIARATFLIENSGSLEETAKQVAKGWSLIFS
jgi:dephospho-CoA kinase